MKSIQCTLHFLSNQPIKMLVTFHYLKTLLNIIGLGLVFVIWSDQVLAEWTELSIDTEFSYIFQDNINHSVFDNEARDEHIWNALVSAGRAYQLTTNTRMLVNAHVNASIHDNFEKLNQLSAGAGLALRHKFGVGAFQPWISGSVSSDYLFYKSRLREGQFTTAGFIVGKRIHDRLALSLNYRFDYRDSRSPKTIADNRLIANGAELGKSSSVFDLMGHSIGVQLNALLSQQWLIILAYNFRDGDIVSSNNPAQSSQLNNIIDAVAIDDALPGWAYRADAKTHRYSVDANYAFLKGHAAFNLAYEYSESHANSFTYRNNLFRVNLMYNF